MRIRRRMMYAISGLALAALIVACATTEAEDAANDGAPQETDTLAGPAPELNLETLRADTPAGTVEAEPYWGDTYVGAVNEDLYIAVSFLEEVAAGPPVEALVYLCGKEVGEYLTGEVGDGTTTFEGEVLDIELSLADDAVRGAVTLDGEEPQPFTANEAGGDAGMYTARFTDDGEDYLAGWVVLPDGSQQGYLHEDDEQQDITYLL